MTSLPYREQMKKSLPKLQLRRETLRVLASMDLTRAIGGGEAAWPTETRGAICTNQAVPKPPGG